MSGRNCAHAIHKSRSCSWHNQMAHLPRSASWRFGSAIDEKLIFGSSTDPSPVLWRFASQIDHSSKELCIRDLTKNGFWLALKDYGIVGDERLVNSEVRRKNPLGIDLSLLLCTFVHVSLPEPQIHMMIPPDRLLDLPLRSHQNPKTPLVGRAPIINNKQKSLGTQQASLDSAGLHLGLRLGQFCQRPVRSQPATHADFTL